MTKLAARPLVLTLMVCGLLSATVGSASAAPTSNGHNCAGTTVSSLAGPDFGSMVSALAHLMGVDNIGLADCGQTNRNNS
jgi:hypothetical protein